MESIFYNIFSIIIGVILIFFGISKIKKNLKLSIISFIHSILFIVFGVLGFIVEDKYSFIVVLAMLAFTLTMLLSLLLVKGKKN